MVFKTSNRSNAKIKMKVWNNENIDYIASANKLPGVPERAVILELAVGRSFIEKYQSLYRNILEKKNFRNIIDFLQSEQKNGRLAFGNESDFHSKNNKCIIVLKEHELNTVLFYKDNSYFDFRTKKAFENINTEFIGNRLVWVELY